ncbi:MAG TPA: methylmalonyl Co-A mutase-associated GTPase MeaB [Anaerolineaceae bacterium]
MDLAAEVRAGSRLALARLLTEVENGTEQGKAALDTLFPYTGHAHLIGITGSPGTGKSSLVNQLARTFRKFSAARVEESNRVGVLAIDPSSPFTGGALLGDRIRMRDISGDPGIFIRSMASRGALGGLAHATAAAAQVLDAAGYNPILIETVGAGQSEVDIARLAHTVIVLQSPGSGDDIQAIKAGILEIADILVINKADQTGVESTEMALRAMLDLVSPSSRESSGWIPPILRTVATTGEGIQEVCEAVYRHQAYLQASGERKQRDYLRLTSELNCLISDLLVQKWRASLPDGAYHQALEKIHSRECSPLQAALELLQFSPKKV